MATRKHTAIIKEAEKKIGETFNMPPLIIGQKPQIKNRATEKSIRKFLYDLWYAVGKGYFDNGLSKDELTSLLDGILFWNASRIVKKAVRDGYYRRTSKKRS